MGQINYEHSDNSMRFLTNGGTEALRLTSSQNATFAGNVGLTDGAAQLAIGHSGSSNWDSAMDHIEVGHSMAIFCETADGADRNAFIGNNLYYNGDLKRLYNDQTSHILFRAGYISFRTDGAATEDVAFTPTERMKIAEDGAITMGGTLGVTGASTFTGKGIFSGEVRVTSNLTFQSNENIRIFSSEAYNRNLNLEFYDSGTGSRRTILFIDGATTGDGKVGIANSSPSYNLDVTGTGRFTGAIIGASYTGGAISGTTGTFSGAVTATTLDTGQGANELYDMDQNVLTTSAVTFATVDTGQGANELYDMDQNVLTTSAVTFATVDTGQGANELYDMDQNVLTTSNVTFGKVTATSKSFLIDHPTKPEKKLEHGSLEGPENGVYVRGKVMNDNVIELPEYWTGLIDEDTITVQLTSIGKFMKLYVKEIKDNKVYVEKSGFGKPSFFYNVYGERKDIDKMIVEY